MPNKQPKSLLITSEMMEKGAVPLLFTGGACNIQYVNGPIRNPGRDKLALWLNKKGWSYFDPQIHPSTHGRDYIWGIDSPQEKIARDKAQLRVYEITSTTIGAITMLEIMDDARLDRTSIVWFNGGESFIPIGLGSRDELQNNVALRKQIGEMGYQHLLAYVKAGCQLRNELALVLHDIPNIVFVTNFDDLKKAIEHFIEPQVAVLESAEEISSDEA